VSLQRRDLRRRHVRDADGTHQPLRVESGQGLSDLGRSGERVRAVEQQDVDHIRPQPGEALLDLLPDRPGAQVVEAVPVAVG